MVGGGRVCCSGGGGGAALGVKVVVAVTVVLVVVAVVSDRVTERERERERERWRQREKQRQRLRQRRVVVGEHGLRRHETLQMQRTTTCTYSGRSTCRKSARFEELSFILCDDSDNNTSTSVLLWFLPLLQLLLQLLPQLWW
jgi:hypothetical protein